MNVHVIMHESFEAPAAVAVWAQGRGHAIAYTRLYRGDVLPQDCAFDFLVIMGGPQSPATTRDECAHFDACREIELIQLAIEHRAAVLGICLGAQLLGEACGVTFAPSPHKEIGVFDVTLTEAGRRDSRFATFPNTFPVGHWHSDMPGLTPDAEVLATSAGCPRQIVKYRPQAYGFQCHFEFTPQAIEGMIHHGAHELAAHQNVPYVQNARQLRAHDYAGMNQLLFDFLDRLAQDIPHRQ